jgi:uncharacterized membrane protein HdeD (DUF308 family)
MTVIQSTPVVNQAQQSLAQRWWIFLLQGILTILLGILLLTNPQATLIAVSLVLGGWWLLTGILDIIAAFTGRKGNSGWGWTLLAGILSAVVGGFLLFQPLSGAAVLPVAYTLLFAIGALLSGLLNVIAAFAMRKEIPGEGWIILWGAIAIVFGLWMLTSLQAASAAMVYVVAIFAIVGGVITMSNAFHLRSLRT